MPSPKKPLKRDLLKNELAHFLDVDVEDIIERQEAASLLGYKNEKSISNNPSSKRVANEKMSFPCFYLGELGRNGIALYSRREVLRWRDDPAYRRASDKLGAAGRPLPWPERKVEGATGKGRLSKPLREYYAAHLRIAETLDP